MARILGLVLAMLAALALVWLLGAGLLAIGRRMGEGWARLRGASPPGLPDDPAASPDLDRAWDAAADAVAAADLADANGARDRLDTARESCRRLLAQAAGDPLDLPLAEWAIFIRRRVPELVERTLALAAASLPPRNAELIGGMVDDLVRIGAEAERRRGASAQAGEEALGTLRRHVANRTEGGSSGS